MNKIRVAIIGYGRSGRNIHRHLLSKLPEQYEIVAFADADKERRAMAKTENNCPVYSHYSELLERTDLDLIINASFSKDHAPISLDLLEHGFSVLSEKPAAGCAEDFAQVMEASRRNGKSYFVFQQYRFSPSFLKIKEIVSSGVLGRIVQIGFQCSGFSRRWDWQTVQGLLGGSLLNTGPHPVDQALDLMGFPEHTKVFCFMDRSHTYGDGEDHAKLLLRAENTPLADIEISASNFYPGDTYLIQGTRGTLKGSVNSLEWKYYIESEQPHQELTLTPLRNEQGEPVYCRETLELHTENWNLPEGANDFDEKGLGYYRSLYETLQNGNPFPITQEQILRQMEVMEEAHRQNETTLDRFVTLP